MDDTGDKASMETPENLSTGSAEPLPAYTPLTGLEGKLIERRDRRRMDLMTFDGILREHGRIYRAFKDGKIGLKKFDAASRALRRHGELLRDREAKIILDRERGTFPAQTDAPPTLGDFYASFASYQDEVRKKVEAERKDPPQ